MLIILNWDPCKATLLNKGLLTVHQLQSRCSEQQARRVVGRWGRAGCACTPWWSLTIGATSKTWPLAACAKPDGWSPGSSADLQQQQRIVFRHEWDSGLSVSATRSEKMRNESSRGKQRAPLTWEVTLRNLWNIEDECQGCNEVHPQNPGNKCLKGWRSISSTNTWTMSCRH